MPPDEFKTQVLLLHREQSTLENLSAGFGDRYTVHCATSGSEALSTLGETPINVIVSAQDLPGMNGLEALREAKKRSPNTIGILIDEGSGQTLEAVVGHEEVFQVVRGNVSRETILDLVDEAAKQLRLMTLSISANDNAASDDSPDGEHIVMETTQNGLTLVTDSSGRVPILSPQRAAEAADAKLQSVDLLVLTRDSAFLETIKDSCRVTHAVHYASTLAQADQTIREFPVGVAIIDAGMIGSKIEQLTEYLRRREPRLVPIVAGRRDDGEMLMDLINRGKVYRFLLKPVSSGRARLAIESSAKFHLDAPDAAFDKKNSAAPSRDDSTVSRGVEAQQMETGLTGELLADERLGDASNGDGGGFTDTISGFFTALGKKSETGAGVDDLDADTNEMEPAASGVARRSLKPGSMTLVVGMTAIALLAGAYYWLDMRGNEVGTVEPTIVKEPRVVTGPAEDAALVEVADPAELTGPAEDTALVEVAVPAEVPGPAERESAGVDETSEDIAGNSVGQEALAAAENALLESRLDDADTALQQAIMADPENERLPALAAELKEARLQQHLGEARSAIQESRLDDAGAALAAARSLDPEEASDIGLLEGELTEAREAERVNEILATANARLDSGALLAPGENNARHFFEQVLATDPENAAARQGLSDIAGKLALQARAEIGEGRLESAEEILATAKNLDPSNTDVSAAAARLASRREAIAAKREAEAADRRAAATSRPTAEPPVQAAATVIDPSSGDDGTAPADSSATAAPAAAVADTSTRISEDTAESPAETTIAAVAAGVDAAPEEDRQADGDSAAPPLTMISSLKRIKYVAPRYPRAAERRNLSGWVDVLFTVATDGTVKEIETGESEPGTTFVNSATKAVAKWQFEPVIEEGVAVEKRVGVRMMFAVE